MTGPTQSPLYPPDNDGTTAVPSLAASEKASDTASGNDTRNAERDRDCEAVEIKKETITDGPPDGGREAWMVVLGAWCCSFCCYGWINSE